MKILVTGATGFVGHHLVRLLLEKKENISCLVRDKNIKDPLFQKVNLIKGCVEDKKSLVNALKNIDVVYHLAAISGKSAVSPKLYQEININGVKNILDASIKQKIKRLVFISSNAVTGSLKKVPGDENSPYNPTNWYEKSKVAGEDLINEAIKKQKLSAVIVRPGSIYGPGNANSNMAQFIKMGAKGFAILPGNGENAWDMIYVSDCVQGIYLAGTVPKINGQTFIITGPKPVKVNEILKMAGFAVKKTPKIIHLPLLPMKITGQVFTLIENLFNLPMPFSAKTVQILSEDRYHTSQKAQKLLGFKPSINIKEGISQTIAWYQENYLL